MGTVGSDYKADGVPGQAVTAPVALLHRTRRQATKRAQSSTGPSWSEGGAASPCSACQAPQRRSWSGERNASARTAFPCRATSKAWRRTAVASRPRIAAASLRVKPLSSSRHVHSSVGTYDDFGDVPASGADVVAGSRLGTEIDRGGDGSINLGAGVVGRGSILAVVEHAAITWSTLAPKRSSREGPKPLTAARTAGVAGRARTSASSVWLVKTW